MGGGDLNLKKSWHPQTLRNIERVWKAEQKYEAEQKKIEQLRKELQEERTREELRQYAEDQGVLKKKSERLDWMYAGPATHVNHEEYLLGRPADKALELLNGDIPDEKEERSKPGAIFGESVCNTAVDLANKIREDPLFTIRKREEESRKELLNNPIRLKQLQQLLKAKLDKKDKKKVKKKKKDKKHKKSHSSQNENDFCPMIKKGKKKKLKSVKVESSQSHYSQTNKYPERSSKHDNDDHTVHKFDHRKERARHDSFSSSEDGTHCQPSKQEGYGLLVKNGCKAKNSLEKCGRYSRSHSPSPSRKVHLKSKLQVNKIDSSQRNSSSRSTLERERYSRSRSKSPHKKQGNSKIFYAHHSQKHSKLSQAEHCRSNSSHSKHRSRSSSPKSEHYEFKNNSQSRNSKRKRDPKEMEKLRLEMMENAKWRDEQLTQNVKRYREEAAQEEEYLRKRNKRAEFVMPMLSKAADTSTVENRIKRNIYNVQRTKIQKDSFLQR